MALLQFFNRFAYLYNLIRLCHFPVPLQIYTGISGPRRFKNVVTADNPWFSKVLAAEFQQIIKSDAAGGVKID
ncbi:MAG: hypothetical protein PHN92_02055 [Geobacter sp.]|nr:hypothetical protein [Geobacter sp.]